MSAALVDPDDPAWTRQWQQAEVLYELGLLHAAARCRTVYLHRHPVAGGDRRAGQADGAPFVKPFAAHPVGDADRFNRRSEGDHREFRHQQERDAVRARTGGAGAGAIC